MPDTRTVRGPDGELYDVPAEATDQQISAYLKAIPAANAPQAPKARTWTDTAVDALPFVGGAIGGLAGAAGGPLGVTAGAALGGAGGQAWKQNINRMRGSEAPSTSGEAAQAIAKDALIQGASGLVGSAIGRGISSGATELATNPQVPQIGSKIGRVVGGLAPTAVEMYEGNGLGALTALALASKTAWAGGKTGWFTAKLAQQLAAPIANAGGAEKFMAALGTMGAAKATRWLIEQGLTPGEAAKTFANLTVKGAE